MGGDVEDDPCQQERGSGGDDSSVSSPSTKHVHPFCYPRSRRVLGLHGPSNGSLGNQSIDPFVIADNDTITSACMCNMIEETFNSFVSIGRLAFFLIISETQNGGFIYT